MSERSQVTDLLRANVQRVIHGKVQAVDLLLTALLAEGHVLIEDVPGIGKTSLARALAASIGGIYHRIQFTPDLLPSDVTGVSIYQQSTQQFIFHAGPIMSNIVVADEINRASPKTQSAMLEVMEERQVTVDGAAHLMPRPFLVVATQNPVDMDGTYRLPEAQLDRFLMRVSMGYPDHESEVTVLATHGAVSTSAVDALYPVVSAQQVMDLIQFADAAYVARSLYDYIVHIAEATRVHPNVRLGVSPRGSLAMLRASRALAVVAGRDYVTADDVKFLAIPVLAHRIIVTPQAELQGVTAAQVLNEVLASIITPEGQAA